MAVQVLEGSLEGRTVGWKRRPPLYGPIAELNCTR